MQPKWKAAAPGIAGPCVGGLIVAADHLGARIPDWAYAVAAIIFVGGLVLSAFLYCRIGLDWLRSTGRTRLGQMLLIAVGVLLVVCGTCAVFYGAFGLISESRASKPLDQSSSGAPTRIYDAADKERLGKVMYDLAAIVNKHARDANIKADEAARIPDRLIISDSKSVITSLTTIKTIVADVDEEIFQKLVPNNAYYKDELKYVFADKEPFLRFQRAVDTYRDSLAIFDASPARGDPNFMRMLGPLRNEFSASSSGFSGWITQTNIRIDAIKQSLRDAK